MPEGNGEREMRKGKVVVLLQGKAQCPKRSGKGKDEISQGFGSFKREKKSLEFLMQSSFSAMGAVREFLPR